MLVFLCTTALVKTIIIYIYPRLVQPLTSSKEELPAWADPIRGHLRKFAEDHGFNPDRIYLEQSHVVSIHANAAVNADEIMLGEQLFR